MALGEGDREMDSGDGQALGLELALHGLWAGWCRGVQTKAHSLGVSQ